MTPFDFLFTLFGLVLGLAMAEAMGGFVHFLKARTLPDKATAALRVGWLTPMLTVIVTLDLITCWGLAWAVREHIPLNIVTMAIGTAFVAIYYIAAGLLWPEDPREWPNLDDWFDRKKRQIAVLILLANIGFSAISVFGGRYSAIPALQYVYLALLLALTITRTRLQSLLVVTALMGVYVWVGFHSLEYWNLS
jgi:hypothetical protein